MSLETIIQNVSDEFGLTPVMAAEIECYVMLPELTQASADDFFAPLLAEWQAETLPIFRIEKERGDRQFEIVTGLMDPRWLAYGLKLIRFLIEARGESLGIKTSFAAKPFVGQPSSGLHLHLHLADAQGLNAYHKTEEWTSDALRWSLGGLLATLNESLPIFFPTPEDYARLSDADHVPKSASWGVNNRYCALRIPAIEDPYHKRIEHRVPCANADPTQAIEAMLAGVLKGLRETIEPPAQEFGKPVVGLIESLALAARREVADETPEIGNIAS